MIFPYRWKCRKRIMRRKITQKEEGHRSTRSAAAASITLSLRRMTLCRDVGRMVMMMMIRHTTSRVIMMTMMEDDQESDYYYTSLTNFFAGRREIWKNEEITQCSICHLAIHLILLHLFGGISELFCPRELWTEVWIAKKRDLERGEETNHQNNNTRSNHQPSFVVLEYVQNNRMRAAIQCVDVCVLLLQDCSVTPAQSTKNKNYRKNILSGDKYISVAASTESH